MVLNTLGAVAIEEYNNGEAGCLITLCCFQNTSSISILNLVMYWVVNNILHGVNFYSIRNQLTIQ